MTIDNQTDGWFFELVFRSETKERQGLLEQAADIQIVNQELERALADSQGVIREMCIHLLVAGGKRLRPLLVLYSGLIFAGPAPGLMQAAVAMELVHMASLVHDDVIDKADLRRNRPSVNKLWGNQAAVLGGDYLFAKAFSVLTENHLLRNLKLTVAAIQEMCHGEIIQAGARFNPDLGLEDYYGRIAKKTAVLLQCACQSGAIAGGAVESQIEQIGRFGLYLGLAFQIGDDILDYTGDSQVMGKPKHEDLVQGNLTLPVLLLLEGSKYGGWIRDLISGKQFQPEDLERVDEALHESGSIKRAFEIADSYIEKAKECLRGLPDNIYRDSLMAMADKLKIRIC